MRSKNTLKLIVLILLVAIFFVTATMALSDRPNLVSVSLGSHVTDIDYDGKNLYMATLFEGVKIVER